MAGRISGLFQAVPRFSAPSPRLYRTGSGLAAAGAAAFTLAALAAVLMASMAASTAVIRREYFLIAPPFRPPAHDEPLKGAPDASRPALNRPNSSHAHHLSRMVRLETRDIAAISRRKHAVRAAESPLRAFACLCVSPMDQWPCFTLWSCPRTAEHRPGITAAFLPAG